MPIHVQRLLQNLDPANAGRRTPHRRLCSGVWPVISHMGVALTRHDYFKDQRRLLLLRVIRVSYSERAGHTEERLNSAPKSSQSVHLSMPRTSPRFALHSPSAAVGLCSPWIYSFPAYEWSKQKRELFKRSPACFTWLCREMGGGGGGLRRKRHEQNVFHHE